MNNPVVTTASKNKQAVSRRRYHSVPRDALREYFSRLCTATLCDRARACRVSYLLLGLRRYKRVCGS